MKKFFIAFCMLILTLIISTTLILNVYETRIINKFTKEIIDKTDISFNFSKINLSLFKHFPYCSIILDDAYVFYTPDKLSDTLLFAKTVSFKINTINLFRSIYEFPEIEVSNGILDIKSDKIELFFLGDGTISTNISYIIKTHRIKIKKSLIKYSLGDNIRINYHVRSATGSGTFQSNAFLVGLNVNVDSLTGTYDKFKFKENTPFFISATIKEKENIFFSENGFIKNNDNSLGFTFSYSLNTDNLKATLAAENISIKHLDNPLFSKIKQQVSAGKISFNAYYSANINNLKSQKLSVTYELSNIKLLIDRKVSIPNLRGTSTLYDDFSKNNTEIKHFELNVSGIDFIGSAKIKGLPQPLVLIDVTIKNKEKIHVYNDLIISGFIDGKLKLLFKIDDTTTFNLSSLKILDLNSKLKITNLSVEKNNTISKLTGEIECDQNKFSFKGKGVLYKSSFEGDILIRDFVDLLLQNQTKSPQIFLNIDRINLDSILLENRNSSAKEYKNGFHLTSKIKKIIYKESEITNLNIRIDYGKGKYTCNQFSLNALSGNLAGTFSYSPTEGIISSLLFQKIDMHKLFKTFNNFDQSFITYNGISGGLSGKADISFRFNNQGDVNPKSIIASSDLVLDNGKLTDLSQFEKLSKFLNLKEVEIIRFKTVENTITIKNGQVNIPTMSIFSNAINLQLSGQHSFTGDFTYWIKVNLKEILAKKFLAKNYNASVYENDKAGGLNLYIKFWGNSEEYKFSFDKMHSLNKIKSNIRKEGSTLKSLIKEEFNSYKKDGSLVRDTLKENSLNKFDTLHNKTRKKAFKIEWDEIDSTKKI